MTPEDLARLTDEQLIDVLWEACWTRMTEQAAPARKEILRRLALARRVVEVARDDHRCQEVLPQDCAMCSALVAHDVAVATAWMPAPSSRGPRCRR